MAPPRLAVAAPALLSLGVGCATFAEYPEASFTPAPTVRSLDVKVVVASYLVANDSEFETARTGGFAAQVVRALEESGRFAPLTEGGAAGELEAMVAVKVYPLYFSHSPAAFEREVTAAMTREAVAEALLAVSDPPGP